MLVLGVLFSFLGQPLVAGAQSNIADQPSVSHQPNASHQTAVSHQPSEPPSPTDPITLKKEDASFASVKPATPTYPAQPAATSTQLLSVTLALVFILAVIFAFAWVVRRFGTGFFAQSAQIKVLSALPLGTRERLLLVDVAGEQMLLGVTATQINCLHKFAEPVVVKSEEKSESDFSQKLMTLLQQKNILDPGKSAGPQQGNS